MHCVPAQREPLGEPPAPSSSKDLFGRLSVLSYGDYDRRTASRGIEMEDNFSIAK
jgi:hypothetical protein